MSPGNLYYHFRNKDDIVEQLFSRYETRIDDALLVPEDRLPNLEDIWLQLHLVFECMWAYRFLYRDLVDILARNRKLKLRFVRILTRASASAAELMRGLARAGIMRASTAEIRALAENVLLVATFWQSYSAVRGGKAEDAQIELGKGIYQVMVLIAPFLREEEREHLNALAGAYAR